MMQRWFYILSVKSPWLVQVLEALQTKSETCRLMEKYLAPDTFEGTEMELPSYIEETSTMDFTHLLDPTKIAGVRPGSLHL